MGANKKITTSHLRHTAVSLCYLRGQRDPRCWNHKSWHYKLCQTVCFPLVYKTFTLCSKIITVKMLKQKPNRGVLNQNRAGHLNFLWVLWVLYRLDHLVCFHFCTQFNFTYSFSRKGTLLCVRCLLSLLVPWPVFSSRRHISLLSCN